MSAIIPQSHRDLLERPITVMLVTLMPDHQPQASPVWCSYDGARILVNTVRGRQKDRNMSARPQVTLLAIDPDDSYRYIEVRGVVDEITEDGAWEHMNSLSARYAGKDDFYDGLPEYRRQETRVIYKIKPVHVNTTG